MKKIVNKGLNELGAQMMNKLFEQNMKSNTKAARGKLRIVKICAKLHE